MPTPPRTPLLTADFAQEAPPPCAKAELNLRWQQLEEKEAVVAARERELESEREKLEQEKRAMTKLGVGPDYL
eukprot:15438042-Alexandrium_andersonii.AAC.1